MSTIEGFNAPRSMSAEQRLLAAAEKIEQHVEVMHDAFSDLPWHVTEDFDGVHAVDGSNVSQAYTRAEDEFIVTAVNAMPALAAWLRWEAEAACVPAHSHKALAVADQILGGAR